MRIYSTGPSDGVQRLDMEANDQLSILGVLGRGVKWEGVWNPPFVWKMKDIPEKRRVKNICDLTSIAFSVDVPVLSRRAKYLIEPLIGDRAQWLPLAVESQDYWLLNSLNVVDALDLDKSEIQYRPNGEIRRIEKYAFKPQSLVDEFLFKIPQASFEVLTTDRLRLLVEKEGLTGFFFQPVWDSEHAPFRPTGRTKDIIGRPEIYGPEGFVPNVREHWPPEWIEQEKEMKKKAKQAAKLRPSQT